MSAANTNLDANQIRNALLDFWGDALSIERLRDSLALAMPQTGADGWQIVIDIETTTPRAIKLTDRGRTLGNLASRGQNIDADATAAHINDILQEGHLEREGWELIRHLPLPLDPADVHVFAEALSTISHLHVLHSPLPKTIDIADKTLRRIFTERKIEPRTNASLSGKAERNVRVDYLVESQQTVAFKILHSRGRLLPSMEQWGFRWLDLRKANENLRPVMLYDPNRQEIDETSQAIGEEVCAYFGPYDQTDRIHDVLEQATR